MRRSGGQEPNKADKTLPPFFLTSPFPPSYTFHHDNLQSVLGLSGHDGTVLQTMAYDPFGNKAATSGSATNNTPMFTGREQDADTGLYYFRARYYDPTLGRFLTQDPKGFAVGVNFYAAMGDNPINANDPYGTFLEDSVLGKQLFFL